MSHYAMLSKYGNCTRLLIIKNKLKIGCFDKKNREEFLIFCGRLYSTIIHSRLLDKWVDYSQPLLAISGHWWNNIVNKSLFKHKIAIVEQSKRGLISLWTCSQAQDFVSKTSSSFWVSKISELTRIQFFRIVPYMYFLPKCSVCYKC